MSATCSVKYGNPIHITLAILCLAAVVQADDNTGAISSAPLGDPLRMTLPSELFAVVGIESNIYFDNVVLTINSSNYAFDVTCPKGRQQAERWTWTPTDSDLGEFPFQLDVKDDQNRLISSGKSKIKVVAVKSDPARVKSLLLVGDSLTHASVYSKHLLDLSSKMGDPLLSLVGTHGLETPLGANRHEGYGGWTAVRFATHFNQTARQGDYKQRGSPFLYQQADGSVKLDFKRYCDEVNQGKIPDVVTIFLGPNDVFSLKDETIADGIEKMLTHFDQLIEMVKSASPPTQLGILLPVPPAASQDAFGSNYGTSLKRWQCRRNQHALLEAMTKRYIDRRNDGIHLISTHTNLDCVHNYPAGPAASNAHSDEKIVRQSNGVHPAAAGYRQIGDTVFAWLASLP